MNTFISCDWGTSAFRLRLVEADTTTVLASIKNEQGIARVYNEWNNNQQTNRIAFYSKILADGVMALEEESRCSLANTPIIISGMASSSIGMMELPYKELPFRMDGADVLTKVIPSLPQFNYSLLLISGARTSKDVMRGEETKLIGCDVQNNAEQQLLLLPGTHTKHIVAAHGTVTDFNTYMTGEMFDLLSVKSVLAASVEKNESEDYSFFLKGVSEAAHSNLLNSIFHVRTSRLFNYHSPQQNYQYLSGLVIGSELKELLHKQYSSITLVATGILSKLYKQALQALSIEIIKETDADKALIAGQCKVYLQMKKI